MTTLRVSLVAVCGMALLLLTSAPMEGKPKDKKPDLPKIFDTAQYVYVEALTGDGMGEDTFPEDRAAISDVERALHDWGRYRRTFHRDEADLVLQVHRARSGTSHIPVVVGGPQVPPGGRVPRGPVNDPSADPSQSGGMGGPGIGMEAGSPDDQLAVFIVNPSGSLNGPIWRQSAKNGLKRPPLTLFLRLRQAVEEAYPH